VAEDDLVVQHLARQLIERRGHTSLVVGAGQEVVDALDSEPFDLILMDVNMPGMDGIEATRAIRETEKAGGSHIPIVAMTASSMEADRQRCLEAGMDGYVTKPLRVERLFELIESLAGPAPGTPR
jgi:CheY-like chemotaxis protein